jgi:uncharacterized protein YndB with AHSA1/START domain
MAERSVVHSTFTIERTYDRPPARVFDAWANPSVKSRWFGGGTDDAPLDLDVDFRVGGHERIRSEPGAYEARYHDIVPDERIVFTYDLSLGGSLVSVSLASVEFRPADGGSGTEMTYTEHGAFFDALDDPELRKNGTGGMFDELGRWLERQAGPIPAAVTLGNQSRSEPDPDPMR